MLEYFEYIFGFLKGISKFGLECLLFFTLLSSPLTAHIEVSSVVNQGLFIVVVIVCFCMF